MPLELSDLDIHRGADRAPYRQVADLIRHAFQEGRVLPGEELPAEGELARMTGLSKNVLRRALDVLVLEGAVEKRAGMPSRRALPPPVRHMTTSRYVEEMARLRTLGEQPHPPVSAFTDDHDVAWADYTVRVNVDHIDATAEQARRLERPAGTYVLRRHFVKLIRGRPVQIQDSVIPQDLIRAVPAPEWEAQPRPGGTMAELWDAGLIVTAVIEEAQARISTPAEQSELELPAPAVVMVVNRVFSGHPKAAEIGEDGQLVDFPLESSIVVVPAAGMILRFETRLDG